MPALDQIDTYASRPTRETTNVLEGKLTFRRSEWWAIVDGSQQLLGPLLGVLDAYSPGDRVAVVISQDGTPFLVWPPKPEGVLFRGYWNWTNSPTSAATGRVGLNTAAWATATELHLATTSGRGRTFDLSLLQAGDEIAFLDESNTNNSGDYTLAGAGTDHGTYWSFPITYVSSSGTVPANNQETSLFIRRGPGGGTGGGGGAAVDATAGATTLPPGSPATATVTEPTPNLFNFAFGIPRGDPGATGAIGPQGATGAQGPQGDPGATGAQGPKGDIGATGSQGPQGTTGPQGIQGVPGPTGPQGATGSGITMKGSVATQANLPPTGNAQGDAYIVQADDSLWIWNGTTWVSGGSIQGPPGPTGQTGAQGPKGDTGAQGIQGVKGDTGATGTQGPKGDTGAQGIQGPAGPSGASTFMAGAGVPSAATGVDGAMYLDTATGRMYGPKAAGAWPATPLGILVRDATTYAQLAAGN